MEGPRPPAESEFPRVLEFLNNHLRPESQWSIAKEYPTALVPSNVHNMRIITEQQQVLSHAVIKPIIIKSPAIIYKVAAIGSVVTDNQHRNQGLSRRIIEECVAEAKKQECDIGILWTNLYDFYRKMDFELAGHEDSFVIEKEFNADSQGLKFMKGPQVSAEAILRLYSQHTVTTIRTVDEIRKYLAIPNSQIYTAWDSSGQLAAYAIEGKGVDLAGYIHEWGGSVTKLLALFSWIRKEKKQAFTVIVPNHSLNLITALNKITPIHNAGYLGMIKIINEEVLFNKFRKAARTIGMTDFVLEKQNGVYHFGIGNDQVAIKDEKEIVRLLFGPMPVMPQFKPETVRTIERLLPMPLWVWGWDSI